MDLVLCSFTEMHYEELHDRVQKLEKRVESIEGAVLVLQDHVNSLEVVEEDEIAAQVERMSELERRVFRLEGRNARTKREKQVEDRVTALEMNLANADGEIRRLNSEVETLKEGK